MKRKSIYKKNGGASIEDYNVKEHFHESGESFEELLQKVLKPIIKEIVEKKQ